MFGGERQSHGWGQVEVDGVDRMDGKDGCSPV